MARITISIAPRVGAIRRIQCDVVGAWRSEAESLVARLGVTFVAENMFAVAQASTGASPDTCLAWFEVLADVAVPCAIAMESTLCFLGLDACFANTDNTDGQG